MKSKEITKCTKTNALFRDFVEHLNKNIGPIVEVIKNMIDSLSATFLPICEKLIYSINFLNKKISRKKFVKLLMSIGYQRNEANSIAWKYHKEHGKYTMLDLIVENNKKEKIIK